jgi:hypothetical protein
VAIVILYILYSKHKQERLFILVCSGRVVKYKCIILPRYRYCDEAYLQPKIQIKSVQYILKIRAIQNWSNCIRNGIGVAAPAPDFLRLWPRLRNTAYFYFKKYSISNTGLTNLHKYVKDKTLVCKDKNFVYS